MSRADNQTEARAPTDRVGSDELRARFAQAMSDLYRSEVPQYGVLLELVADVNAAATRQGHGHRPTELGMQARLALERHGAIRVGTAAELRTLGRIFAVMGMEPVGYYNLAAAGVPVHSTAFRPVTAQGLAANPFRVFASLLRLELVEDKGLRSEAAAILQRRAIFTPAALELTCRFEEAGYLRSDEADRFVQEILQTFRWHPAATVTAETYRRLHEAHRLVADVVCFKGPHINHLTPRTLDIDAVQALMPSRRIEAKDEIEGPPARRVPILLRQTSFKALLEPIRFQGEGAAAVGAHTARFGEVEQRGMALTRKGRTLYDTLLQRAHSGTQGSYEDRLAAAFADFPDDLDAIRKRGLGYFRYALADPARAVHGGIDALVDTGAVSATPITYEDFLPVSAAGIFQSNLGASSIACAIGGAAQSVFEAALGRRVMDEFELYAAEQQASIDHTLGALKCLTPLDVL